MPDPLPISWIDVRWTGQVAAILAGRKTGFARSGERSLIRFLEGDLDSVLRLPILSIFA